MALTVYSDIVLSQHNFAAGLRGKQIRRNSRVTTDSGAESINVVWVRTLRQFELGLVPMRREEWMAVETIHEITEGGACGFLLEDPKDSKVSSGEGVAVALTSTTFQLYKRYLHAASGRYKDRKITRLDGDSFALGGGLTGTLDENTGIVTIPSAPAASGVAWTAERFYVPVHFMDDFIDWGIVGSGQTADARFVEGLNVVLMEILE